MADGYTQCIAGINGHLFPDRKTQDVIQHGRYLFLGGATLPGYGLFDPPGGIFRVGHAFSDGSCDGNPLGPAEFQHRLDVLALKRGFDCQFIRSVPDDQFPGPVKDPAEFFRARIQVEEGQDTAFHDPQLLATDIDDAEAQDIGPWVNAQDAKVSTPHRLKLVILLT